MNFTTRLDNWVAFACDIGPSQVIQSIVNETKCQRLYFSSGDMESIKHLASIIKQKKASGLICGTSQSSDGYHNEACVRRAAYLAGVPVVCIEDYPGNYKEVEQAPTRLLIVEDDFSTQIYEKRNIKLPTVAIPSIRYDALRKPSSSKNLYEQQISRHVLWAGQPETEYCIESLTYILPKIKDLSLKLMFRAHPNDKGYHNGAYLEILKNSNVDWSDVTEKPIGKDFFNGIALVVTQFSSVAIEAGFYGIPSLNLLLPEAGANLLKTKTESQPLMTDFYKASFVIKNHLELNVLDYAINNQEKRDEIIMNFNRLYCTTKKQLPLLLDAIECILI